jgi:hypothetical protein
MLLRHAVYVVRITSLGGHGRLPALRLLDRVLGTVAGNLEQALYVIGFAPFIEYSAFWAGFDPGFDPC